MNSVHELISRPNEPVCHRESAGPGVHRTNPSALQVQPSGRAARGGLEVGDVIDRLAGCDMHRLDKAAAALRTARGSLQLHVRRSVGEGRGEMVTN